MAQTLPEEGNAPSARLAKGDSHFRLPRRTAARFASLSRRFLSPALDFGTPFGLTSSARRACALICYESDYISHCSLSPLPRFFPTAPSPARPLSEKHFLYLGETQIIYLVLRNVLSGRDSTGAVGWTPIHGVTSTECCGFVIYATCQRTRCSKLAQD